MGHVLVNLMAQLTPLSEEEILAIESSFPIKSYAKGEYLLRHGAIAKEAYYLIKGCIRAFMLLDGEEKIIAIYTENQSVANFESITNHSPSKVSFVCNEDVEVAIVSVAREKALYQKYPRFETFCRDGLEQMLGAKQEQFSTFITLKPEQRYKWLQEKRPELINRLPQYQIASYLGIKPETLSRIRARMASKNKG